MLWSAELIVKGKKTDLKNWKKVEKKCGNQQRLKLNYCTFCKINRKQNK